MKTILEFAEEEIVEREMALHGWEAFSLIHDLDQKLRSILKYDSEPEMDTNTVEKLRTWLWEEMNERGLSNIQ